MAPRPWIDSTYVTMYFHAQVRIWIVVTAIVLPQQLHQCAHCCSPSSHVGIATFDCSGFVFLEVTNSWKESMLRILTYISSSYGPHSRICLMDKFHISPDTMYSAQFSATPCKKCDIWFCCLHLLKSWSVKFLYVQQPRREAQLCWNIHCLWGMLQAMQHDCFYCCQNNYPG